MRCKAKSHPRTELIYCHPGTLIDRAAFVGGDIRKYLRVVALLALACIPELGFSYICVMLSHFAGTLFRVVLLQML